MKRISKSAAGCLMAGMMLAIAARAGDMAMGGNPYGQVVARNVFGLNPPPPPGPAEPAEPPPKITPNGIMSIFGSLQALFKVTVITPGQPAKEKSYMLTEGQREDEIEVVKIDEKGAIITFNNHGTIQELPLANAQASSGGPSPSPIGGIPPPRPTFGGFTGNRFGGNPAFNNAMNFRNRMGGNNSQMNSVPSPMGGFGNSYNPGNNNANQQSQMSAEEQAVMIAAQHLQAEQSGDPTAQLFPPTQVDNEAGIKGSTGSLPPPP